MITLSPRLSKLLTEATQTPDLETALWKVFSDYVELKISVLKTSIAQFEEKWGMSFAEFSQRCRDNTLDRDVYSWQIEQEFWDWEQAMTLLEHYKSLQL